jgi:hypothetical protein
VIFDPHLPSGRKEKREKRKEVSGRRCRQVLGRQVAGKAMFACEQWSLPGRAIWGAFAAFAAFGWNDGDFRGLATLHLLVLDAAFGAFAPG